MLYPRLVLVLFFVTLTFLEINGHPYVKKTIIPEHQSRTICCDPGQIIYIVRANYGRNPRCSAWNSNAKVKQICSNRRSCRLLASNSVFGDPCRGTYKYLYVEYRCVQSGVKTALLCEHQSKMICCEPGKVIFIEKANYGRRNKEICPHTSIRTTNCVCSRSLGIVKQKCNNRRSCTLEAKNSVFGDPCYGTFKYLDVSYRCKMPSGTHTAIICEHQAKTIMCDTGKVIAVVSANYGRTDKSTCPHTSIRTTNCRASSSFSKVKLLCNNRGACRLEAKNSVFGDPCYGTFKYLEVKYRCEAPVVPCNGKCRANSYCRLNKCYCRFGYNGNAYSSKGCTALPCYGLCKKNAYCKSNRCYCKSGYIGSAYRGCIPLPCYGKCKANTYCKSNTCYCKSGYTGDPYGKKGCTPNPCGGKCKPHSTCKNNKCICNDGYLGDGAVLCKLPCNGQCPDHSYCKNDKCVCRPGFKKDSDKGCRLPCDGHCGHYAYCDDVTDACKCKEGWKGDPKVKCERPGSCNGWLCAENAECIDSQCVCKEGYFGQGNYKCEEKCMCTACGDPHFKTYDGQMIHFQGICKYLLTKLSCKDCTFSVEIKNGRQGNDKRVSYVRTLDVKIYNKTFKFFQGNKVQIDGVYKYLPVVDLAGRYQLYLSGSHVRMLTSCGLTVLWNGISTVQVSVPRKYGKQLTGICGNCNGVKDDFRTKDGKDVSKDKNKFKLIGESYLVPDDSKQPDKTCSSEEIDDTCDAKLLSVAKTTEFCGFLSPDYPTSPFKACISAHKEDAAHYFKFCVYDVCEYENEEDVVHNILCRALEGFASFCESKGFHVLWRSATKCPIKCGKNKVYSSAVSGCPATCMNIQAPNSCQLPDTEGCTCKKGYVESGDDCVDQFDCGCLTESIGYLPLYKTWMINQCTEIVKCDISKGYPDLEHSPVACHKNAYCGVVDGVPSCICSVGYTGDGIKSCKPASYSWLYVRSTAKVIYGREKLRKKGKPE